MKSKKAPSFLIKELEKTLTLKRKKRAIEFAKTLPMLEVLKDGTVILKRVKDDI